MTPGRSFQWIAGTFGAVTMAGIVAMIFAQGRSVFRVPYSDATDAFLAWCTMGGMVDAVAGQRYLAMFGDRYLWSDLGAGLVASGVAGLILTIAAYCNAPDERWLLSPARRLHFFLAGWAIIGWTWFASSNSFTVDLNRQVFPTCADSIGIPLSGLAVITLAMVFLCTLSGTLLMIGFGTLPAPLDQWDRSRPARSWIVTIAFSALFLLVGFSMVAGARTSESIGNAGGLVALYLLASTRAALLAPKPEGE